jgi:hypothetical protein
MAAVTFCWRGCLCGIGAGEPGPVVVESQRPERVLFDLAAELHLKFDVVVVTYRKGMRQSGLATRRDRPPRRHTFVVNR